MLYFGASRYQRERTHLHSVASGIVPDQKIFLSYWQLISGDKIKPLALLRQPKLAFTAKNTP
jgi:hypothetical protein